MPTKRTLRDLLMQLVKANGTDLHISAKSPPRARINGVLNPLPQEMVSREEADVLCFEMANDAHRQRFEKTGEVDFSFGIEGISRFRANVYKEKESTAGAFRALPWKIPTFESLGLPEMIQDIVKIRNGLVLVTGATGSGKSTTIASILNQINQVREEHMITVEDPIEYIFNHGTCMIHQREIGEHSESFKTALKYILRQDPDIVFVGEMRDLETIQAAITTAETGHLVFATLHTNSSVQTIDRIIDVFPAAQQPQVRSQLASIIVAVLSQQLIPIKGGGRRLLLEMLFPTHAIRNLIREGKTHQIYAQMQTSQAKTGMQTMNQSILKLLLEGVVDFELARTFSQDVEELVQLKNKHKITSLSASSSAQRSAPPAQPKLTPK